MKAYFVLIMFVCLHFGSVILAQKIKPKASFTFNNHKSEDRVGHIHPKLKDVSFCEDRFGNPEHAIRIYGNEFSYANLGNSKVLKPRSGTISLWVKIEREVHTGTGYMVNPILLTKNERINDFFEAYGIYYHLEDKRLNASCARDSLRQTGIIGKEKFTLYKWHHIAITYDDNFFSFYVDGELQRKAPKNYETTFLQNDSVLVGLSGNRKNNRYMDGAVDDIEFFDEVLSDEEITELFAAPNPNQRVVNLNRLLYFLLVVVFLITFYYLISYQLKLKAKQEKKRLEMKNLVLETELRVNRALMNPHFVFNSLNSLQNFILKNENERANNYLVRFSKLMRKILENNLSDQISLEMEIDLLNRYVEIENMRFDENIAYNIQIDADLNPRIVYIPVMLLQPFVENAIWHGLLKKEGVKELTVQFKKVGFDYVKCIIEDNGKGREQVDESKVKKSSLAISFVRQRLDLFNQMYNLKCVLEISDRLEGTGTLVSILLPILNKNESFKSNHH